MRSALPLVLSLPFLAATMAPTAAADLAVPGRTPANAHLVISIPSTDGAWSDLAKTPLAAPLEERVNSLMGFGEPDSPGMQQMIASLEEELGYSLSLPDLMTQTLNGVDVYFLDQGGQAGYLANAAFNNPSDARRTFQQIRTEAGQARGVTRGVSAATVVESVSGRAQLLELPAFEMFFALEDNILSYGTQKRFVESALANEGGVLFQSNYYFSFMDELEDEEASLWVFGEPIWLLDLVPREAVAPVVRAFLQHPPPLGLKARVSPEALYCVTFVPQGEMSAPERRFTLAAPPPGRLPILDHIPAGSEFMYATNAFDGVHLLERALASLPREENEFPISSEGLQHSVEASRDLLGFDIETDLLANAGPDLALAVWPDGADGQGAAMPDFLFAANLRDPERVEDVLSILEDVLDNSLAPPARAGRGGEDATPAPVPPLFLRENILGERVHVVNPERAGIGEDGMLPAYTITRAGMFLLAGDREVLRRSLQARREEVPSMRADSGFLEHAEIFGGERNTQWYIRVPTLRQHAYLLGFLPTEMPAMLMDPPEYVDSFSLGTIYTPAGARREFLVHFGNSE